MNSRGQSPARNRTPSPRSRNRTPLSSPVRAPAPRNTNQTLARIRNQMKGLLKMNKNFFYVLGGSKALQLYGRRYGVPTREPRNVNVIVPRKYMQNVYMSLKAAGFRNLNAPPQGSGFQKPIHFHGVDLLPNGSNLAPKISKNSAFLFNNNLYLLSPNNLRHLKQKSLNNVPGNAKNNILRNLNSLEKIRRLHHHSRTKLF